MPALLEALRGHSKDFAYGTYTGEAAQTNPG